MPLNRLYRRQLDIFKQEHPAYPRHLSPTIKRIKSIDTANGLQNFIQEWCRLYGYFAKRVNVTGINRDGKWTKSGSTIGFSDTTFNVRTADGIVPVYCEVKIKKDIQQESQQKFQARCNRTGIETYIIVHTAQEFLDWWDSMGIVDNYRAPVGTVEELPESGELPEQSPRVRSVQVGSDQVLAAVLRFKEMDNEPNK